MAVTISEEERESPGKFGGIEAIREDCHSERSLPFFDVLNLNLKHSIRMLLKALAFSISTILFLALGIGSLSTIATWTNAVLYSPWPHVQSPRELPFIDATVLESQGYSVHYDQYLNCGCGSGYRGIGSIFAVLFLRSILFGVSAPTLSAIF